MSVRIRTIKLMSVVGAPLVGHGVVTRPSRGRHACSPHERVFCNAHMSKTLVIDHTQRLERRAGNAHVTTSHLISSDTWTSKACMIHETTCRRLPETRVADRAAYHRAYFMILLFFQINLIKTFPRSGIYRTGDLPLSA
jgi:hypothetical protein